MSTIKSSSENLTLNADGSGNDIKFQSNGVEKASLTDGGVFTATSFAGNGANLTSVTDSTKLPLAGGTMTGALTVNGGSVFNEASADVDFRIESDAYTHAFMLQGSDGFVGLGINVPLNLLHLRGGSDNSSTGAPIIRMQKQSGGAVADGQTIGGMSFWVNDDGVDSGASKERAKIVATSQNTSSGTNLQFWTGNSNANIAERIRIQADGKVGIGTNAPTNLLHVKGTGAEQINLETTGGATTILAIALKNSANTWQIENGRASNVLSFRNSIGGETIRSHANGVTAFNSGIALGVGLNNTASNVLDDYEEGESTITISPASGSITLKSTHNKCVFTKVGRLVSFNIHIRVDSISSPSGGVNINGLPFACASDEKFRASASVSPVYNFSSPSGSMALAWVGNSSTSMNFAFYNGSTQTLNAGGYFQVNTEAYITGSYMTA